MAVGEDSQTEGNSGLRMESGWPELAQGRKGNTPLPSAGDVSGGECRTG